MIDLRTYNEHMEALTTALSELSSRVRQLEAVQIPLGGVLGPHSILSVTHPDTTVAAVVRGDVITGQGIAPTWTRLAVGGANTVLTSDGTDASWQAAAGANHDLLSITHPDTDPDSPVSGDIIRASDDVGSLWERYPIGTHWQLLGVNAGQTLPEWQSFDWDFHVIAAGGDGVHDHSNDSEGGLLPVGSITAHNLLSATHGDTTVQAVSRGSIVTGQGAVPTWNELVLGGITGSVITRDATDVLWSAYALAGTAGQTYTFPAASANIPGGSGVANQVAVWSGANTLGGSANLTFTTFLYANGGVTVDCAFAVANRLRLRDAVTPADYGTAFHSGAGGNLHFDSYSGGTYFNFYSGTSLVLCGAPGVRTVTVAPTGVLINGLAAPAAWLDVIGDLLVEGFFVTLATQIIGGTAVTNTPLEVLRINSRVNTAGTGYANGGGSKISIWAETATDGVNSAVSDYMAFWVDATAISRKAMAQITAYDLFKRVGISIYADGTTSLIGIGETFSFTNLPDRLLHTEIADAVTNAITYATRTSHTTSGTAAALYGVGHEDELEDAAGNMQVASEQVTLWSVATSGAESPLLRLTTYPAGTAGPGYSGHWTWTGVDGTARTVIPNGAGDVTRALTVLYQVYESAGGLAGGTATVANGASVNLYTDGVDTLALAVAADGSVTVQRTAGAATFDVVLWGVWL